MPDQSRTDQSQHSPLDTEDEHSTEICLEQSDLPIWTTKK